MPSFMMAIISAVHVFACVALVVSILLQSGRGGGLAGAFGAGSSQTLFGGRGAATFLTRASTALAVVFFVTSLTLGLSSSRQTVPTGRSLVQEEAKRRAEQQAAGEPTGQPSSPTGGPAGAGQAPGQLPPTPGAMAPGSAGPGAMPGTSAPPPAGSPSSANPTPAPQGGETPAQTGTK